MKKAVVVGHTGQDGYYLSELLLTKSYEVLGISSKQVATNKYGFTQLNVLDKGQVEVLLQKVQPDEIYFLAAVHQSSADVQMEEGILFQNSLDLNVRTAGYFLEGIRLHSPKSKFFYASSSHVFGSPAISPQDEQTPFQPECIYGITKTAGIGALRYYRENHNIFAGAGIFYNHESPRRASKYVSKKIVEGAVAIKKKRQTELVLGSLESKIDWGYAPDYMKAVHAMMQLPRAGDFVISSGELHTIQDFVEGVFGYLGLNWLEYVKLNPGLITKKQKTNLFGNNQKIKKETGWSTSVDFKGLVNIMVEEELKKDAGR